MKMSKDEALNKLEVLFNAKNSTDERVKALIDLIEFVILSCDNDDDIERKVSDDVEELEVIENPYRLKAEGSI